MIQSAKIHFLLATMLAVVIALFTWAAATAYDACCRWPNHKETYTFDPSVPSGLYAAINTAAQTWTTSSASTWAWINSPTPGRLIKYVPIDGASGVLAEVTRVHNPTTLIISAMEMRFDQAESWYTGTGTPGSGEKDLLGVATHEFGHALGLRHSNASCPGNTTDPTMCPGYNGTSMRTLENDDTLGLQALYPPLVQWYWRGSEGRTRQVPVIDGVPDFSQVQPWSSATTALPGSGSLHALAYVAVGSTMYQELWQNNTRWTRSIPIVGGIVQDGSGTLWLSGLSQFSFGTMPDTSPPLPALDVQVNNFYVLCTTLKQQFWRNDKGFYRDIPITSGVPQWGSAGAWQGPVSLSAITVGSGSLQAYSVYRVGDHLTQTVWRNNLGYYRDVPLSGCSENWGSATAWNTTGIPLTSLLGSGDMRGQDNYELRQ